MNATCFRDAILLFVLVAVVTWRPFCCLYRLPLLRSGHVVDAAILPLPWWVVSGDL